MDVLFIFPLLYFATAGVVVVLVVIALWRTMKAQEATAASLQQIAHAVSRIGPPA